MAKTRNPFLLIALLITILLSFQSQCGVMQITLNNLKNVLGSYDQLYILFHNPQCVHSRKYVQSFLKTQTQFKLGVVDCLRQLQLCNKYNFTYFPVLTKLNRQNRDNNLTQIIDQQQFLVEHRLKQFNAEEVLLNRFVRWLEDQHGYAIVVFQDYGLPTEKKQRIDSVQERIIYLQPYSIQNTSNFTRLLSSFVNNQQGCWIFKKSQQKQNMQKFYCGSGYNKTSTKRYIEQYKQNKLKKFIFSQDKIALKQNHYNSENVYQLLQKFNKGYLDTCVLIYFTSSHCASCNDKDQQSIKKILKKFNLSKELHLRKFNIDKNQIPQKLTKLGLKRVPEIMYVCDGKTKIFGKIFFLKNIQEFVYNSHLKKYQQTIIENQIRNDTNKAEFLERLNDQF